VKVWILQTGEPLHCDGGNPRPMRAMNLADMLVGRGHSVVIWSSAFYHQEKVHRTTKFESLKINDLLTINLIPSVGYKKNIGLSRLIDHAQLAWNLSRILEKDIFTKPDVAFVGYPPIECSFVVAHYLTNKSIPFVLDVKDQWPDIFLEPFPKILGL